MNASLRALVRERAGRRCEYCHLPETDADFLAFHVDHVIARQHGGTDDAGMLCWACAECNWAKGPNLAGLLDGRNTAANPFAMATLCEKGKNGDQYVYAAKSYTWVKDLGLTVGVMFEGEGKMRSKFLQSVEYAEFEKAAKSICKSVEKANCPTGPFSVTLSASSS